MHTVVETDDYSLPWAVVQRFGIVVAQFMYWGDACQYAAYMTWARAGD